MNLQCPNCQQMLTVPEQYAGQPMRCPLCSGTFTVPALPQAAGAPADTTAPGASDVYGVRHEPELAPTPAPAFHTDPIAAPPPPDLHPAPAPAPAPAPVSAPAPYEPLPTTPSGPAEPAAYRHTSTLRFSPRVLQWVAPVSLVLIFVLLFFPWLGIYPGGVPAVWQNGWQAAFGGHSTDQDMMDFPLVEGSMKEKEKTNAIPGASVLTIFYILLYFPVLAVTVFCLVVSLRPMQLPAAVQGLLPWRWGIAAAANLLLFFFLGMQLLMGFSLDSTWANWVEKKVEKKENLKTDEQKKLEASQNIGLEYRRHTWVLRLTALLQIVALLSTTFLFLHGKGSLDKPPPRLQFQW